MVRHCAPWLGMLAIIPSGYWQTCDACVPLPSNPLPMDGDAGYNADAADLTVEEISRDQYYYYVRYCNRGETSDEGTFVVRITNLNTSAAFETNGLYPFSVPAPDTCATTGGITCGLIGDPNCSATIPVRGEVDSSENISEADETNNGFDADF